MPEQPSHAAIYERIKDFVMGEGGMRARRIDVQRLADAHHVSTTPVREVLYELVGERLVGAHPAGGFQIILPDGLALQHLYSWYGQHLLATVHLLPDPVMRKVVQPFAATAAALRASDPAELVARLALAIGSASGNAEVEAQIAGANDRLHRARRVEAVLFADGLREFASIVKANGFDVRNNVRRRLLAYHRRRVEHAAQLAALID